MRAAPTPLSPPDAASEDPAVAGAENGATAPVLVGSIEAVARSRLLTVLAGTRLIEVAAQLSGTQISVVVVCDEAGVAMGTITETLLIRHLGLGQADFFATHAGDVMIREFATCEPEDLLSDVLAAMQARSLVYVLLVGANGQPLGVLNARDGLRALLAAGNHEEALLRNYVMGVGYQ
jgi:CBS domain-containing protein